MLEGENVQDLIFHCYCEMGVCVEGTDNLGTHSLEDNNEQYRLACRNLYYIEPSLEKVLSDTQGTAAKHQKSAFHPAAPRPL